MIPKIVLGLIIVALVIPAQVTITGPGSLRGPSEATGISTITLVASILAPQTVGGANVTTSPVNTGGANGIALVVLDYVAASTPSVADSLTGCPSPCNTWTVGVTVADSSPVTRATIFYCTACTSGPGHTFSTTTPTSPNLPYSTLVVYAFAHANGVTFWDSNSNSNASTGVGSSFQAGSATCSVSNCAYVVGIGMYQPITGIGINSSFASPLGYSPSSSPFLIGGYASYLIQNSPAAENPTWSWTGSNSNASAVIAAFR
jgi:hypothetical protein